LASAVMMSALAASAPVSVPLGQVADGREGAGRVAGVEPGLGLEQAQAGGEVGERGGAAGLGEAGGGLGEALRAEVLEAAEPLGGAAIVGGQVGAREQLIEEGDGGDVVLALAGEDRVASGAAGEPQAATGLGGRSIVGDGRGRGGGGVDRRGVERRGGVAATGGGAGEQGEGDRGATSRHGDLPQRRQR
jgi:hypothetical protein